MLLRRKSIGANDLLSRSTKFELNFDVYAICVDNQMIISRRKLLVKGDQTQFDLWEKRQVKEEIIDAIDLDGWAKSSSESRLTGYLAIRSPIENWQR